MLSNCLSDGTQEWEGQAGQMTYGCPVFSRVCLSIPYMKGFLCIIQKLSYLQRVLI